MAVKLRLKRMGAKQKPFYRIIVADSRSPRDGRFIESVGTYNPRLAENKVVVNEERTLYWLVNGAQPTDTVKSLLIQTKTWASYKAPKKAAKKVEKKETTKKETTKAKKVTKKDM